MNEIQTCVNCRTRVIKMNNGNCPSCGYDAEIKRKENPEAEFGKISVKRKILNIRQFAIIILTITLAIMALSGNRRHYTEAEAQDARDRRGYNPDSYEAIQGHRLAKLTMVIALFSVGGFLVYFFRNPPDSD